jgi:26S proteasome regulatory subunit N8
VCVQDVNLSQALAQKSNDMMLSVYTATAIRGVIALHDLINNKLANKEHEAKLAAKLETERKREQEEDAKEKDDESPPRVAAKEGF